MGKLSLQRPALNASNRKQLVGLLTADASVILEEGAQVMVERRSRSPVRPSGHVTSSYYSAALNRSIALALVSGGRALIGKTLYVPMPDGDIPVQVTSPVFYDPEGARLHA